MSLKIIPFSLLLTKKFKISNLAFKTLYPQTQTHFLRFSSPSSHDAPLRQGDLCSTAHLLQVSWQVLCLLCYLLVLASKIQLPPFPGNLLEILAVFLPLVSVFILLLSMVIQRTGFFPQTLSQQILNSLKIQIRESSPFISCPRG